MVPVIKCRSCGKGSENMASEYCSKECQIELLNKVAYSGIIIDDDKDMVDSIMPFLIDAGITILAVGYDGNDAFQIVKECDPTFVILDMNMPKFNGNYAIEKIKEFSPQTIIIVVTGNSDYKFDKTKVAAVFIKPYNVHELIQFLCNQICK